MRRGEGKADCEFEGPAVLDGEGTFVRLAVSAARERVRERVYLYLCLSLFLCACASARNHARTGELRRFVVQFLRASHFHH